MVMIWPPMLMVFPVGPPEPVEVPVLGPVVVNVLPLPVVVGMVEAMLPAVRAPLPPLSWLMISRPEESIACDA